MKINLCLIILIVFSSVLHSMELKNNKVREYQQGHKKEESKSRRPGHCSGKLREKLEDLQLYESLKLQELDKILASIKSGYTFKLNSMPIKIYILNFLETDHLGHLFSELASAIQTHKAFHVFLCDQNVIKYLINTYIQNQFKKNKSLDQVLDEVIESLEALQIGIKKYKGTISEGLLENIAQIYEPIAQNLAKECLISQNVYITNLDENLIEAIELDDNYGVRLMLAAGANPDAKSGRDQELALILAINKPEILKALLFAGANPDEQAACKDTALIRAAHDNHFKAVKVLLSFGADPNIRGELGDVALVKASLKDADPRIINILLADKRTDPNIKNDNGFTALMFAQNIDIVNNLLASPKIDPNILDEHGETALMYAIWNGDVKKVKAILSHPKTNLNMRNSLGETAFNIAESLENNEIVALIRDSWVKKFIGL